MQKCPTCLKEDVISTKDSHIFPNIYFQAMQKRFKEALYTLGKAEGTQVFYGRRSPFNNEETKNSNPDWYPAEEAESHPHAISQKNLVCDTCEGNFSSFIETTQVGNNLTKIREKCKQKHTGDSVKIICKKYKQEYDSQVAYDFYALVISMLHRVDISKERYHNYNFKTNESEILRTIIDDIFQGKTDIDLLKDLSFTIYQFKGNIDDNKINTYEELVAVKDEDDENKRFAIFIGEILTYDNSYKIILGDFIIEFSFDKSKSLENSDANKLIINVLDNEEDWKAKTKPFLDALNAHKLVLIDKYLNDATSNVDILREVKKDLFVNSNIAFSSFEKIKMYIIMQVKYHENDFFH